MDGFCYLCLVHWTKAGLGDRVSNTTRLHRERGSLSLLEREKREGR